jgi:hypothetical protein
MSYDELVKSITLNADSSLAVYTGPPGMPGSLASPNHAGKMYRFVKVTGARTVGLCTSHDDAGIGILQSKPQVVGQAATVAIFGVSQVIAGAQLSAGAKVSSDSEGRAVAVGDGVTYGILLEDVGGAGQLVPVLLG